MFKPTVLLIHHDEVHKAFIQAALEENNIQVVTLRLNEDVLPFIQEQNPPQFLTEQQIDLILIDPGERYLLECLTLIENFKENPLLGPLPILVFGPKDPAFRCEAFSKGAIGVVSSIFRSEELIQLIKAIFYQLEVLKPKNSATGLANGIWIEQEINRRLERQECFSIACIKAHQIDFIREKYGFDIMGEIIRELAVIITVAIHDLGAEDDFVGQMDSSTFILVTKPERVETLCREIIEVFEKDFKLLHYNEEDQKNGYMSYRGRRGELQKIPFISLAIGISSNAKKPFFSSSQAIQIAQEVQKKALNSNKSEYHKDQRVLLLPDHNPTRDGKIG